MPIGTITMVLANVGLQIYNNWCGSRQNEQLRQKREEFEQAALERNTQRMWQIMREGQALTLELEEQKHQQRLKDLQNEVDNLLHSMAYSAAINNWPLNVLPIVMKNQALGNLLARQEETIALHCILTPSNCNSFNTAIFPLLEESLETFCNQHWSIASDHPILFYSGAWKSNTHPTEVQIASMRTALSNLPTLLITPEFRPTDDKLVFQVRIWGVGASSSDEFTIPEIEPTKFQRDYTFSLDYTHDTELASEALEDLVPYLQCLIGYMADTYFWSSLGKAPILPRLLTDGIINTDGMKYLLEATKGNYEKLIIEENKNSFEQPFEDTKALSLYDGTSCYYQEETRKSKLEEIFISYCSKHTAKEFHSIAECLDVSNFTKEDLPFIRKFRSLYNSHQEELKEIQSVLESIDFDYSLLESTDVAYLEKFADEGNKIAMFRLGEIYEYSIGKDYDEDLSNEYYELSKSFILTRIHNFINKKNTVELKDYEKKQLKLLYKIGVVQAILYVAILQEDHNYTFVEEPTLQILDKIEFANHPYSFFWGALLIKKLYSKQYITSYIDLLERSAKLGYLKAIKTLSTDYMNATFLSENPQKHVFYCQLAVKQGDLDSIADLGVCYATGYGLKRNRENAIKLLTFAAKEGCEDAKAFLQRLK